MPTVSNITRLLSWLSASVIGTVVIVFPAGYFFLTYLYMAGSVETEAEINARIITQIISTNPRMWEFEQVRIKEYLSHRPDRGDPETRRVVNIENELIAETAVDLQSPVLKRSVELYDAGVMVGRLEISRSLRPVLMRSGLIALAMLPLAIGAFVILRNLPLRAIRKSELERKRLEDQLHRAQRLESVGQLAGGIAHDFNNILSVIIGYGELLLMDMKEDDPLRRHAVQLIAAADRAALLTQGLLAFSRKQVIRTRPLDLNDVIRNVADLLRRLIGERIELRTAVGEGALTIMADPGQIEQVLMNLATNARDAMPEGGSFTIETRRVELTAEYVRTLGFGAPGEYVIVTVSDTGTGMDANTKEKIFDPFFTTKEVGKGTGLGLAVVYGIIQQLGGHITVYTEPGIGTTFKIFLLAAGSVAAKQATALPLAPMRGTETILLAEDDPDVRNMTRLVLENFGYSVLEASDGQEALELFAGHKDEIGLVILDVIMPKKVGTAVYEEMKKIRPDAGRDLHERLHCRHGRQRCAHRPGFGLPVKTGCSRRAAAQGEKPARSISLVRVLAASVAVPKCQRENVVRDASVRHIVPAQLKIVFRPY